MERDILLTDICSMAYSIVQDSPEDWECEALTMDQVYVNGICNLAACDSLNSSCGMFRSRDSQYAPVIRIETTFRDGARNFVIAANWVHLVRIHAPLYQRAWVVQERFLSNRIMQVSGFPIWECHQRLTTRNYRQAKQLAADFESDLLSGDLRPVRTEESSMAPSQTS